MKVKHNDKIMPTIFINGEQQWGWNIIPTPDDEDSNTSFYEAEDNQAILLKADNPLISDLTLEAMTNNYTLPVHGKLDSVDYWSKGDLEFNNLDGCSRALYFNGAEFMTNDSSFISTNNTLTVGEITSNPLVFT